MSSEISLATFEEWRRAGPDGIIARAEEERESINSNPWLRAVIVAALLHWAAELPGGRGKRDTQGRGKEALLTRLAAALSVPGKRPVNPNSLDTAGYVFSYFMAGRFEGEIDRVAVPLNPLDWSYYAVSITWRKPEEALKFASESLACGNFSIEQFRGKIREWKARDKGKAVATVKTGPPIKAVRLSAEARRAAAFLCTYTPRRRLTNHINSLIVQMAREDGWTDEDPE